MASKISVPAMRAGLGALAVAGALLAAAAPAGAKTLADQDVFGTVKLVSPSALVLSHITTGRAVPSSTLTYSIAGASVTAPAHWVLEKDQILAAMLKNPFWQKLIKSSSSATSLLSKLRNPSTPSTQSKIWVNRWGPVSLGYLTAGDLVYGVSGLSEAEVGQRELAGKPVPLATIQDETNHVPAPAATLAEKLQAKLFALELASLTH
jgi:hypothetical protein